MQFGLGKEVEEGELYEQLEQITPSGAKTEEQGNCCRKDKEEAVALALGSSGGGRKEKDSRSCSWNPPGQKKGGSGGVSQWFT